MQAVSLGLQSQKTALGLITSLQKAYRLGLLTLTRFGPLVPAVQCLTPTSKAPPSNPAAARHTTSPDSYSTRSSHDGRFIHNYCMPWFRFTTCKWFLSSCKGISHVDDHQIINTVHFHCISTARRAGRRSRFPLWGGQGCKFFLWFLTFLSY